MDLKDKVLELNAKLIEARHAYYVEAIPIMDDKDYDSLEKELADLVAQEPDLKRYATILNTVGSDLRDAANRIKHHTPMLSLENQYLVEDVEKWMSGLPAGTVVCIEPKVDGLSLELTYINRKLLQATTRGDGNYGEDVTPQVFASPSIPKNLHPNFPTTPVIIRGEAFILRSVFDRLNTEAEAVGDKKYANPRNLAAGTLKLKNLQEVKNRDIRFQPWEVHGIPEDKLGASKDLEFLYRNSKIGEPSWRQPLLTRVYEARGLKKAIDELAHERSNHWNRLGMDTDGIVLKVENKDLRKKLGSGTKYPNWACCYKFPSELVKTKLLDVIWQTGRTGILSPVGILDPVNVSGSLISRVSLNNLSFMQNMGLKIGSVVALEKGGEVIPKVTKLVAEGNEDIKAPSTCPECGSKTEMFEDPKSKVLSCYCTNFGCPGKLKAHLVYIGQRTMLDIEGLGPQLADKFVDEKVIGDIGDLYLWYQDMEEALKTYDEEDLGDMIREQGWPVAQTLELIRGLRSSMNLGWDKWLAAIGIPGVGLVLGKTIAKHLELGPDDMINLGPKLLTLGEEETAIEGVGVKKFDGISAWCQSEYAVTICKKLSDAGVRPKSVASPKLNGSQPLKGLNICITGEFSDLGDRDYLHQVITSLGGTIRGISKKLHILVACEGAGPSKMTKARELGIQIEDSHWLTKLFEDNNIKKHNKFEVEDVIEDI